MRGLTWILIALSALGFVLAVVGSMTQVRTLGVAPEGFSRACTNLALLAIAVLIASEKRPM